MKNKIYLLVAIFFNCLITSGQAPDWQWAKSAGTNYTDDGKSVSTDINGNVLVTGSFGSASITFGTITLNNAGNSDMFIVKYDATGNVLWAKRAGGGDPDEGSSVAVDFSGNVYVTGYFVSPSITFGTTILSNTGIGFEEVYLVKYDASGNVLWAKKGAGNYSDRSKSIAVDGNGNVLMTGYFDSDSIKFGTITLNNTGNNDMFIVKYDASGNVLWAKKAGGSLHDYSLSVATDIGGNILMSGYFFSSSITFGSITLNNAGNCDMFITKYDASGNVLWAKSAGGGNEDRAFSCVTDNSGNVLVTGSFSSSTITFGTIALSNTGYRDMFIVKYDTSGNVLWAKNPDGIVDEEGYSITVDSSQNSFVTGYFASPTITFGSITLTNTIAGDNIFIVKYDTFGNVAWAKNVDGNVVDRSYSIAADLNGSILVTGYFTSDSIAFGTTILTNVGDFDIFIAKLDTTIVTGIKEMENISNGISIYPNPANDIIQINSSLNFPATEIILYDASGREVMEKKFNGNVSFSIKLLNAGIYFYKIKDAKGNEVRGKLVKE